MSPDLVVHFERTAYRRFTAASWAVRSFTNTFSENGDEARLTILDCPSRARATPLSSLASLSLRSHGSARAARCHAR